MKKKIISLITTLVMAISLIGVMPVVSASAAEVSGDYMYEVLPNGTVEILYYAGSASSLTIPSTLGGKKVTSIGYAAFYNCSSLTSVIIPNSVKIIDVGAFFKCVNLKSITIGSSVTSIGESAFRDCLSLKSVTMGSSVKNIDNFAFYNCLSLTRITIPNSVVSIGVSAFSYCESLISVTIPNSVMSIGSGAFYLCESLKSVTIPGSVASIPDLAFAECYDLSSVTILNGVMNIEKFAFAYCDSLKSVTIPNSVTSVYNGAFDSCASLKSITIPSSVTSIGYHAFGCMSSKDDASVYYKIYGFKIYCYAGTAGYNYAKDNGFQYEVINRIGTVSGFKTSSVSSTAVKLKWNKVSGAQGYIVYKYDNSKKTWVRVAKTKTTANTYTVSKLKSGTSYKFAVKAYKTVNGKEITSSKFPTVTAITKLPAVVNGRTSIGKNSVKLTWKKTTGAQGYIVYKYNNAKKTWQRVAKTKSLSYLVKKLKSGTNYKFAVKAYKYVNKKEITSVSFKTISVKTKK